MHFTVIPQHFARTIVKAMNDAVGENCFVSSRKVFRTVLRLLVMNINLPAQKNRMEAIESA